MCEIEKLMCDVKLLCIGGGGGLFVLLLCVLDVDIMVLEW